MSVEGDLNKRYLEAKRIINEAQRNEQLVLFVGSGASISAGMPSWKQAVKSIAEKLGVDLNSQDDYLKIPQYYYNSRGPKEYTQLMREIFMYEKYCPSQLIHDLLIRFNTRTIITTNYDHLIEQAAEKNSEMIKVVSKDADLPYRKSGRELIKIHGDFENNNFVLKEDDYLSYSRNFKLIENYIKSIIGTKVVLFIGYSFNDPDVKQFFSWVKDILKGDFQPAYFIETKNAYNINLDSYFERFGINMLYSSVRLGKEFCEDETKNLEKMLEWLLDEENKTELEELHYRIRIFKDFNYSYSNHIEATLRKLGYLIEGGYVCTESFPLWNRKEKENKLNDCLEALAFERYIQKPSDVYVMGNNNEKIKFNLKNRRSINKEESELIKDILYVFNKSSFHGIILYFPVDGEYPLLENEINLSGNYHRVFIDFDEYNNIPRWLECNYYFDENGLKEISNKNSSRLNENVPELYMEQAYIHSCLSEYLATYNCLKTAASLFYRKNKKINYYIAETNRFFIGKMITNNRFLFGISQEENEEIKKEIDALDLERTYKSLTDLRIDSDILKEISSFDISYKLFQNAFKISEKITEQANTKYNFFSGLPAFSEMKRSILDFYYFENLNYILSDKYNDTNLIYKLYFQSLLTSVSSPDLGSDDNDEISNIHIDSLSDFELFLGLKYISYRDLQKNCSNIDSFNIDEKGKDYIEEVINRSNAPYADGIWGHNLHFWKIVLLLGYVNIDKSLFELVIDRLCEYAKGVDYREYRNAILKFVDNAVVYEIVDANNVIYVHKLLSNILEYLKKGMQLDASALSRLITYLADLCQKYNDTYDEDMVIDALLNNRMQLLCLELFPLVGDKTKILIKNKNINLSQSDEFEGFRQYCVAVINGVITQDSKCEKRIFEYCKNEKEQESSSKTIAISFGSSGPNYIQLLMILSDMYLRDLIIDKEGFVELVEEIKNPFSTWLIDIEQFDYNNFNLEWLNECYDRLLKKIGENNIAKKGIGKKISEEYEQGRVDNRIMRKYFKYFV